MHQFQDVFYSNPPALLFSHCTLGNGSYLSRPACLRLGKITHVHITRAPNCARKKIKKVIGHQKAYAQVLYIDGYRNRDPVHLPCS